jgi:hypothetical protein
MPEDENDPIASTQMFRKFVAQPEPGAATKRRNTQLLVGLVVLAVVLAGVVVLLAR